MTCFFLMAAKIEGIEILEQNVVGSWESAINNLSKTLRDNLIE